MLFASDLDRTLIYSHRCLDESIDIGLIELVETLEDREISYMLKSSIDLIYELHKKLLFVPVTTRTSDQYKRIDFFNKKLELPYVITTNGGVVLKNNKIDNEWNDIIVKRLKHDSMAMEDVISICKKELLDTKLCHRIIEVGEFFFYFMIKETIEIHILNQLELLLMNTNWNIFTNKRKIFFVPKCVCKKDAVKYVAEQTGENFIISAGDSKFDIDMQEVSNHFISPKDGDIFRLLDNDFVKSNVVFTEQQGMFAASDILQYVYQLWLHKS